MKTKRLTAATILACVLASTFLLRAQPDSLDLTFNPGTGANFSILCMALQTNGQIIIGGYFTTFNGANRSHIARLNTDGSVDTSFDPGVGPNDAVRTLALQSDGKIIIGGGFTYLNGVWWSYLARLRANGSVDTSFDMNPAHGAGPDGGSVFAVASQADGKVLIGGAFSKFNGTNQNTLARLNTNGTLDLTFNPGTGLAGSYGNYANTLGLQSDGRIVVGGPFNAINGVSRNYLARLNTNGSVDTMFDAGIAGSDSVARSVQCLVVTPEDKLVIGGNFTFVNGYSRNGIARLNADGSVDTTFNPGLGADGYVSSVAVQADGKVVLGGWFTHIDGTYRTFVARLNTNGTLDLTFNPGTVLGSSIACVACQPDGKMLVGGPVSSFNGVTMPGIARLNGDSSSTTLNLLNAQIYFGLNLSGVVSNTYRIEYTSKLNTPSLWTPLFNVTLQTNPQFILDPNPAGGQRFYRAVQLSP